MTIGEGVLFPPVRLDVGRRDLLSLLAAFVVLAGAGAIIPLLGQPLLIFVPIAAVAALALIVRRIDLGIYVLIAATALNGYNFAIAGWNAKIENLVVLMVLAALACRIASGRERAQRLPFALLFGSLLAVNVLSSVLNSADLYKSVRIIVRMGLAVTTMYVIFTYVSDRARLIGTVRALLIVGAAASAFGIIAFIIWYLLGYDFGIQRNPDTGAICARGTLWEANIFGSYVAGTAALSGGLLLSRVRVFHRGFLSVVFALAAIALILSLTRGAWLGFAVGAVLAVMFLRGARLSVVLLVVAVAVMGMALVLKFDIGGASQDISDRFASFQTIRADSTALGRVRNFDRALADWRQNPILGRGTDGFHINHPEYGSVPPSASLGALYDTGLVGLAIFMTAVGALFFRCAAASTRRHDDALATLLGALTIAAIVQFVAFQITDAFWLGYIWVYFGLMLGAVRLINEGARD